jgi:cytochrome c oxidase subunit 3
MADAVASDIHAQPPGHSSGDAHAHAEGHGHSPYPFVQHHFDTPAQQFDAGKLGMWLFLVTEVLFFAGLFCAYAIYRRTHPEIFVVGSRFLDTKWGAINTVVLILSSFTMALGVWCAQTSRRVGLIVCLILTLCGAFGFMAIKYIEYSHKITSGIVWGKNFNPVDHNAADHGHGAAAHATTAPHGETYAAHSAASAPAEHAAGAPGHAEPSHAAPTSPPPAVASSPATGPATSAPTVLKLEQSTVKIAPSGPAGIASQHHHAGRQDTGIDPYAEAKRMRDLQIFIAIYFCLTGLHGFHVLGGIVVISCLLVGAFKGRYDSQYYTPVDLIGLYWHIVDLVWIFLFPLLYLI